MVASFFFILEMSLYASSSVYLSMKSISLSISSLLKSQAKYINNISDELICIFSVILFDSFRIV